MNPVATAILIFDEVEILDFCGPFEVFAATRLDEARRRETTSPYRVRLLAEDRGPVRARGGLRVLPDTTLARAGLPDLLVIPGGWGVRAQLANAAVIDWLRSVGGAVDTLASVCTGSMLLGEAGLLDGLEATTHWQSLDWMSERFPEVQVSRDRHVVDTGRVVTSAGISAGIDMALALVARQFGPAVAQATAAHMEYPWPGDNRRRV